jgi:hypothetical protein
MNINIIAEDVYFNATIRYIYRYLAAHDRPLLTMPST